MNQRLPVARLLETLARPRGVHERREAFGLRPVYRRFWLMAAQQLNKTQVVIHAPTNSTRHD